MVKIEFGKRDFIWVGLIVVLFSFSFVYSYGGSSPNVMGHSGGEIELNGNTVVNDAFCQKITGKNCGSTVVALYCGDGSCNNGETCSSCSGDCGACYVAPYCGDGSCNNGETCSSCSGDCGACAVATVTCNSQVMTHYVSSQGSCRDTLPTWTGPAGTRVSAPTSWGDRSPGSSCAIASSAPRSTPYLGTVFGGSYGTCENYCKVTAVCTASGWTDTGYSW